MKKSKSSFKRRKLSFTNSLYTNYKAEVVVSGLIEGGMPADNIRIIRKGKSQRANSKEIDEVLREYSHNEFIEYLNIYVHKRDLYDSLPEGLFHSTYISENKKGKTGIINAIKRTRQEEFNARFFFKPFEMAIDRMLISAQLYEQRLEKRTRHEEFIRLLQSDWKILRDIPLDKALFTLNFLSQSYRISTPEQVAQVVSVFLDCSVFIERECKSLTIKDENQWQLGNGRLGLTTFMGGAVTDSFYLINVRIENLLRRHKKLIDPHSLAHKQLLNFLDLFIPADAELALSFKIAGEEANFILSDIPEEAPLLGFTTIFSQTDKEDESIKS